MRARFSRRRPVARATIKCARLVKDENYILAQLSTSASPDVNGAIYPFPSISQGTLDNQREGHYISARNLLITMRYSIIEQGDYISPLYLVFAAQGYVEVNCAIVRFKRCSAFIQGSNTISYPNLYRIDGENTTMPQDGLAFVGDYPIDKDNYQVLYRRAWKMAVGNDTFAIANAGVTGTANNANPFTGATHGFKTKRVRIPLFKRLEYSPSNTKYHLNENIAVFHWVSNPYQTTTTLGSFTVDTFAPVRFTLDAVLYYTDI